MIYLGSTSDTRITENSDRRITEDGDVRVLEDLVLSFYFTPRTETFDSMLFISETTGTTFTATITDITVNDNDVKVSFTIPDLPLDCYYRISVKEGSAERWRGKAFIRSVLSNPYSVNTNEYISHSSNNEFITI